MFDKHDTSNINFTSVYEDSITKFFELYQNVFDSGLYNFEVCRIPLQIRFNIDFFSGLCFPIMRTQW